MIPYYPQPAIHLGRLSIHAFGVLGALATLLAFWIILRRAHRRGIAMEEMFQFVCVMYLCGLAGAFFASTIMADPQAFVTHPGRVFHVAVGIRSCGGLMGGLLSGLAWSAFRRLSLYETLRRFDVLVYAFPAAWMVGRLGCALAHDHRGLWTTSWIAVRFPEGQRYDLGLIEFIFLIGMSACFWALDRKPRPVGFFFALYAAPYGAFRIWLDTLHAEPLRYYEGATYVVIGLLIWSMVWKLDRSRVEEVGAMPAAV
jgi:phosphatidylglycerol:prolipoprotein diacylglycerol transferase